MPDICMCTDNTCPANKLCYRYTTKETPGRQAFFKISPRRPDGSCEFYYPVLVKG